MREQHSNSATLLNTYFTQLHSLVRMLPLGLYILTPGNITVLVPCVETFVSSSTTSLMCFGDI